MKLFWFFLNVRILFESHKDKTAFELIRFLQKEKTSDIDSQCQVGKASLREQNNCTFVFFYIN